MIERILAKSFQNHDHFEAVLGPVTVFVGSNGSGKSAALRAFKWVLTNRPLGTDMVGDWGAADYTFVKLWLDGRTAARSRGEGVNEYRLDGKVLAVPGSGGPPGPVADLADVGEINFQGQHDGAYWFLLSPGEVARRMNEVVNLGKIDAALAEASSRVRKAKAAVGVSADRLRAATVARDATRWAVGLHARAVHAQDEFLESEKLAIKSTEIDDLVSGILRAAQTRDRASGAILYAERACRLLADAEKAAGQADAIDGLVRQIESHRRLAGRKLPSLDRLDRLRAEALAAETESRAITTLLFGMENLQWEVKNYDGQIAETRDALAALAGKNCPACGRPNPGESSWPSSPPTGTSATTSRPQEAKDVRRGISRRGTPSNR